MKVKCINTMDNYSNSCYKDFVKGNIYESTDNNKRKLSLKSEQGEYFIVCEHWLDFRLSKNFRKHFKVIK